ELYAAATKELAKDAADLSFALRVLQDNNTVPVIILTNEGKIGGKRNLDSLLEKDSVYLAGQLEEMKKLYPPIEIEYAPGKINLVEVNTSYIFYGESFTLKQLRYYPYVQLMIIGLFLLIAYTLFSTARRSEQNLVWVGMSKETAHQLGTPLSSLMAWMELL